MLVRSRKEGPARVRHLDQALLGHIEDTEFLGRSEAVLRRPQKPERCGALAFQAENGIDQMLEGLGAGQRSVLGYVSDDYHRDRVLLGQFHQAQSAFSDLADAAGGTLEFLDSGRLD